MAIAVPEPLWIRYVLHKGIAREKYVSYILFMPKLEKTYDARLELKLESELKADLTACAKRDGISVNELVRRAIAQRLYDYIVQEEWAPKGTGQIKSGTTNAPKD